MHSELCCLVIFRLAPRFIAIVFHEAFVIRAAKTHSRCVFIVLFARLVNSMLLLCQVTRLIELNHVPPDARVPANGYPALCTAAEHGHTEVVQYLVEKVLFAGVRSQTLSLSHAPLLLSPAE